MPNQLGRLYGIGYTALVARQRQLDTMSDNMANVNTPGFKDRRISFQAALSMEGDELVRRGVEVSSAVPTFSQGPVQATDQPWDLAIDGAGFFMVQMPNGQIGYTRVGNFRLDSGNHVVTEQGWPLSPAVTLPQGATDVSIDAHGFITYKAQGGAFATLGRLQLARFPNPEGLIEQGNGIYAPSVASGAAVGGVPAEAGMGQVIAGALEMSNVDIGKELVNMLQVQRGYGLSLKALQISDQMATITNQLNA